VYAKPLPPLNYCNILRKPLPPLNYCNILRKPLPPMNYCNILRSYAKPTPTEASAATKIATAWRRIRRRKVYMQGLVALERWQQQQVRPSLCQLSTSASRLAADAAAQTAELRVPVQLWFDRRFAVCLCTTASPPPVPHPHSAFVVTTSDPLISFHPLCLCDHSEQSRAAAQRASAEAAGGCRG
jgi:hypothetical protein